MEPLTEKQRAVLEFIEAALAKNSPPSQREIAEHFGLAQNSIHQIVRYLKKKGYLDKTSGPSSHETAAWVKRLMKIAQAGHGGTLEASVDEARDILE